MGIICGWHIANAVIKKSFKEEIYITPVKLNCLVYLLYSDYLFNTGKKLFDEYFIKTDNGLVLSSVEFKFNGFKDNVITEFARDSKNVIQMLSGNLFEARLLCVWNKYKNMGDIELLTFLNNTYSTYQKENNQIIDDIEILDNEIRINESVLEKAKHNRKILQRNNS